MSTAEDAVFGNVGASGSTSDEDQSGGDSATDPSKPHVDVDTRDGREEDAIRQHEYRAQSNTHSSSRKDGHGADPWHRMLHDKVEKAFHKLRSQHQDNQKKRRKQAPFRVVIKDPNSKAKVRRYFWHGPDILELICKTIIPVARGDVKVRVQKRISNRQEWHSGQNQPHLCAEVRMDEAMFGLEKFIRTYNWDVWKTRLPELAEAKALA